MEKSFKFLTSINGIYTTSKMVDNLTVFYEPLDCLIKICYKSIKIDGDPGEPISGEIILKNIGYMEYDFIFNNIDKPIIKELIFNKYMDMVGETLYVDKIY